MTRRVVYDCVVLLQAAGSPSGPAADCLTAAERPDVVLCICPAVIAEVRDVLNRPKTRRKLPRLTDAVVNEFLARLGMIAVAIDPVPEAFRLTRDPDDSVYLNLAIAAGAELVVSRDKDLLELMTGTDPDAVAFRTDYPAIAPSTRWRSFKRCRPLRRSEPRSGGGR